MSIKVCVWPDKMVSGWDGDLSNPAQEFPVVDLLTALTTGYTTDAHFTIGLIHDEEQPRLKKYRANGASALKAYRDIGLDPVFSCVAVDVDRPEAQDNDPDGWWASQLVLLAMSPVWSTAGWYRTKGGYRLVWTLEKPVNAEDYEVLQRRIYNEMSRVGVKVDVLPDWTRCFRLPYVTRDGKEQNHPVDFSRMGHLDISALGDVAEIKKIATAPMSASNPWEQDLTAAGHNRNKGLLKLAIMTLKGLPDLPDEYLDLFIRSIHDAKCDEPLPEDELRRIIQNARKYRPEVPEVVSNPAAADTGANDGFVFGERRQVLVTPGEMVRALDDTLAILAKNKGCLYNMGGGLVRLKRDVEEFLVFEEIPLPALRTVVERMVEYVKTCKNGVASIDAPRDLIQMLAVMADYGDNIWKLQEILTTPTLTPSGMPLATRGYHEDLAIYLDCPESLEDLDLNGDPDAAFKYVQDLLVDVPFERDEHKAVAMTSLITPVVRTAIQGPIPIVLFDSTTRGSGKGLLADMTSIIATGRRAVIQPYVNEQEFEKRVTALLQMGLRTVVIDNIDRPFGGPTLDALLTADMWTGRVLGETKMIKFRSRAHWMATGNNIQIQGDLDRRALRCYIAPGMENPEKRDPSKYKYPQILKHISGNRREYIQAILTFMKAYIDKGCPQVPGTLGLGSFEEWSRIVRGAVMFYGMADPVASQDALRSDSAVAVWGILLGAAKNIWGDNWFSARELYDTAFRQAAGIGSKASIVQLETSLEELLGTGQPSARAVTFILKRWLNRVVDGKKLVKSAQKDRTKGYVFKIEEV